jgi:hypothetical protein
VDLVQVDVVGAEAAEAVVERFGEVAAGCATGERSGGQGIAGFGGESDVVAAFAESFSEEGFGFTPAVRRSRGSWS